MNFEDVLNDDRLQQDEWSLTAPTFGDESQLEVIGWSGKQGGKGNKFYILKCSKCNQDKELFGGGYFRSLKGHLVKGQVPCGCGRRPRWSKEQYRVLCKRKAQEIGYTFLGFDGDWKNQTTKIRMSCEKHGEWGSGIIHSLISSGYGCPGCKVEVLTKSDSVMITSFFDSGGFHPDTKFWRSDRLNNQGRYPYWHMSCPECGESGESISNHLQTGHRPCACSKMRQQECYINLIKNEYNGAVAIKFGVANDSKRRIKQQNSKSTYTLYQHSVYQFLDVGSCKKAERECRQELECGVVLKRDLVDGYTETTHLANLDKIIEIYQRNGGVLKWSSQTF